MTQTFPREANFERIALDPTSWLDYAPNWLGTEAADALLADLLANQTWEARSIVVAGREILQPRLMSWAGELAYKYSGLTIEPRPMDDTVQALNAAVSAICEAPFNHVMGNLYRDGRDKVSMHADAEPELGRDPVIAAISLGSERKFRLESKDRRRTRKHLMLGHGSLVIMGGSCQHRWRHEIPRVNQLQEPRVSLTFRVLKGPPGWRAPRPDWAAKRPQKTAD
ncbi:MAG: alpha-ketoglutarate-dependent dioxygenase AlkB [Myxococcales bacterium]|nr:alpha-ketoglutarate-dependent dioxygenase AlkB [Myxococcales bacterium]